ncbi:hypothetical protein DPMN_031120 [Dreissena polymorpha]|uniref:Uncharacterized protein n=1 Tax=Dreissena polymorpha TaxID=45954 RepID=A0A9D4M259_DREPO|nr:hypothetical protein DPMN_031120 [Dreissena polymorpha]
MPDENNNEALKGNTKLNPSKWKMPAKKDSKAQATPATSSESTDSLILQCL